MRRWMQTNLNTQGYCLSEPEGRALWLGLRFSTGLCLALVVVALALGSPVMLFALTGVGLVASVSARHPFDHVWNHAIRPLAGAPEVPPTPRGRRFGFRIATGWLALVGALMAAGATTAAIVLGGLLVAACGAVTVLNLCLPSMALAWWDGRRPGTAVINTYEESAA